MKVRDLRAALEGVSDDTEVIIEWGGGQHGACYAEVCTHENGSLHYPTDTVKASIQNGESEGFDPECWDQLDAPTFKITR